MLQSFLVYGFLTLMLSFLGKISAQKQAINQKNGNPTSFWTWDIVLALFIFAFISGIRWQVGVDHLSYLSGYENIINGYDFRDGENVEIGFNLISKLFATLNIHFVFYFAFWAFLQIFFIYYTLKNECYLLPFIGIVIIGGSFYIGWMGGIRQVLATTMFIFSVQFISKRKLIPYAITILLAATIHKSAILLFIFYFVPQYDYFKNRYINIALLIGSLILGLTPTFIHSFEFIEKTLALVGYNRYSERFDLMIENHREMVIGPRRFSILLLNIFTIWFAPKLKKVFEETNYLVFFNFTFVGVLLYNLLANTSHIFLRPVRYFTTFLILTTAYLLYYLKSQTPNGVSLRFLFVFIVAISYTLLSVIADYGKGDVDFSNFKFFWDYI